jgi:Protein of unknown function (DUF2442)
MTNKFHTIESVEFQGQDLILRVDGHEYRVAVSAVSPRLMQASNEARRFFKVSPSGYGIHWPEADEDLSVDGLIAAAKRGTKTAMPSDVSALREEPKSYNE